MRKTCSLALSALLLGMLAKPLPARAETNYGQIAMHVAYMLQNHHLSHREFDDQVSKQLLENYLNFLDFSHIYFTQQDVDDFRTKFSTTLDDHIVTRNISPAIEIYDIYQQRVKERVAYATKVVETKKFTFDSDRQFQLKREKAPWPQNKAASDKLWDELIEGDLLSERISDKAKEDAAKKKAETKAKKEAEKAANPEAKKEASADKPTPAVAKSTPSVEPPEDEGTPEKRVLKRYERLAKQLSENNEQEDVVNYFLQCLAQTYDPHTDYMSQQENDNFKISMTHSLVGIGALLMTKDNVAEIQGIVVGGPADKQGELKLNDKILAVAQGEKGEYQDIKYMKLQKIVELIRGKSGSTVRLKVHPGSADDPSMVKEIVITRSEVELKEKLANAELLVTPPMNGKSSKIGWINLSSFYADMDGGTVSTTVDVSRLLKRLMKEHIDGLVVDLRGDGGGSLEEAIKMTGLFIPAGPVVQAKDWKDNITWRDSEGERPVYDGPLIVLTDKASASASEIFAAALQDYRRAIIVGEKSTFGKGTVQTILPVERYMPFFSDKSRAGALKVTIQKFYRIAGGSTQLKGVIPDVSLPSMRDVMEIGEDALKNPLPYDTIPSRTFTFWSKTPLPSEQLRTLAQARINANPEFKYIMEDTKRLKERIDKNSVSLNEKVRLQELEENKQRNEARKEERKVRVKDVADKNKEGFQTFRLTLDNVDQPQLIKESTVTKEQTTGMRLASGASTDDEEVPAENSQFTFGVEPVKLETINIMRDWIDLSSHQPQTANTTPGPKKASGS
jgi:carboxyl-terminal processing protease